MDIAADPELALAGGAPIWEQIDGQIRGLILNRVLQPGEELPTVRALAVGLGVNPRAVAYAYGRLEGSGFLIHDGQGGPRVADPPASRRSDLERLCRDFWQRTAEHGYTLAEVLRALQRLLEKG
jgi:GntR family transcriptional regulator